MLSDKKQKKIEEIYKRFCMEALDIKDINKWANKKTVTSKMISGSTVSGAKAFSACSEAIDRGIIDGVQEGDKIWVYQYIKGKKQLVVKGEPQSLKDGTPKLVDENALRFVDIFDEDYDKWHYVSRVHATLDILKNVIDIKEYPKYHNKAQRKLLESL